MISFEKAFLQKIQDASYEGAKIAFQEFSQGKAPLQDYQSEKVRFINKKEAALIAAVSVSTIDNWRRAGKIKPHQIGGNVRFNYSDFIEFLSNQ